MGDTDLREIAKKLVRVENGVIVLRGPLHLPSGLHPKFALLPAVNPENSAEDAQTIQEWLVKLLYTIGYEVATEYKLCHARTSTRRGRMNLSPDEVVGKAIQYALPHVGRI